MFFILGNSSKVQAAETVNARDFGATPGVNESQTDAIHEAMRYFYNRGVDGTVYLPAGTYAIDEELRFHAGVNLVGDGVGETVIKKVGTSVNYVVGEPVLYSSSDNLNVTVSDITFDGDRENRATQGLGQIGGMLIEQAFSNLTLERIEVRNVTNGAVIRRMRDSVIRDSFFDNTTGHAIATGMEGYPVGDFRNVLITNNLITNSSGGSGINLSRAAHTTVTNNRVINEVQQSDSYGGIRIPNGGEYNTVSNNTVENYPRGIFVLTGAKHNTITDNTVINSRIHGILIQSDNNTFSGNLLKQTDPSLQPESIIRLAPASNTQITNNQIETFDGFSNTGIRVTGDSNNNEIKNNSIDTSGTLVSIEGGSNNVDEGNTYEYFDPDTTYQLVNRNSGKLLEVASASTDNGANIQQWSGNGCACQDWFISETGDGYYKIVNELSQKALDVYNFSSDNGANIVQWTDLGGANQQFLIDINSDGYFQLINQNSGKALDVFEASTIDGGNVVQWDRNNGWNQQWEIVATN